MLRTVQYSLKQLIVSVLQQLFEVWHVRWAEAASLAAAEKHYQTNEHGGNPRNSNFYIAVKLTVPASQIARFLSFKSIAP